jgi:hypothetical protein
MWISDGSATFDVAPEQRPASDDVPALREGTRILLADDNADMRGYVRRLLGRCDVQRSRMDKRRSRRFARIVPT